MQYNKEPNLYVFTYLPEFSLCNNRWIGDVVSPGFFQDFLTAQATSYSYHDSAEGYLYDFAINLQTLNYLQTLSQLNETQVDTALIYMQTSRNYFSTYIYARTTFKFRSNK